MERKWCYFLFLLWLCYLLLSSVLMFTRGFLLTRISQNNTSTCIPNESLPCAPNDASSYNITNGHAYKCSTRDKYMSALHNYNIASKVCLSQRSKVVLIVIDALKYDFCTYDAAITEPLPFQNKLVIINEMVKKRPENSRLYKFIADPPTTTLQRLKGLTTGSLPTFIDAGSNFGAPAIDEDNIIDQLNTLNKTIVFMGDDTWVSLYPKQFLRTYSYPSFNVWDLDTVDNGVMKKLVPNIKTNDWNLLIAHFLGVDHCGHRYGPFHPEMERKLKEMNDMIQLLIETIDDDTTLIVIGDHGMTDTGDHGGDSEAEITAAMFLYSPKPLINNEELNIKIKQVDLVPTLSVILGVPIPFSNLGTLITDAIPSLNTTKESLNDKEHLFLAMWKNVQQTYDYIKHYASTTGQFQDDHIETLDKKYMALKSKFLSSQNEPNSKNFMKESQEFILQIRQMCEDEWIQFDSFSMSRGLLLMFLTIFFTYMIIDGIPNERLPEIFMSSFLVCSYGAMGIAAIISFISYFLHIVENLTLTLFFSTGMVSVFMLAMLVIQNWEVIAISWYDSRKITDFVPVVCRIVLFLSTSALFSNSYIVEEGTVLSFLFFTLLYTVIFSSNFDKVLTKSKQYDKYGMFKFHWSSLKMKLFMIGVFTSILIRFSQYYWRCREEQSLWCNIVATSNKISSSTTHLQTIITLIALGLVISVIRMWLRSCGNLTGFSPSVMITRYVPSVIIVCAGGFWLLHRLPNETKNKSQISLQADMFSWVVYGAISLAIIVLIIQPLCLYIIPRKKDSLPIHNQENIIPQLFNHVKNLYQSKSSGNNNSSTQELPIVCGLATVYSSTFIIFSMYILLLFSLLLGDILAPSAIIMYTSAAMTLVIISLSRYEKVSNIDELFHISGTPIFCWVLLSHYFFYGTGHQPTFPNIHWEAAFVGTSGKFIHNAIPAILVGINTFGSYILFAVTLPLLLIAPFTIYVMFPHIFHIKKDDKKEIKRGELMLYERDEMLFNGVFTICAKYILFHGIRMFLCMLAATIHCRHLMVWKIFAPKLIFEGLGFFVTVPFVLIGYLLLVRINHRVDILINNLHKQNR